jgi:hypothetical protein
VGLALFLLPRPTDEPVPTSGSRAAGTPSSIQRSQHAAHQLAFLQCSVSLQPILEQLSALTCLTYLSLVRCPLGLTALSAGLPPRRRLVYLASSDCGLSVLPPLQHLCSLEELDISDNEHLADVQLGLRGLTSLTKLRMESTPVNDSTLVALHQLPALREFDIRDQDLTPATATTFGLLHHTAHARHVKLVLRY